MVCSVCMWTCDGLVTSRSIQMDGWMDGNRKKYPDYWIGSYLKLKRSLISVSIPCEINFFPYPSLVSCGSELRISYDTASPLLPPGSSEVTELVTQITRMSNRFFRLNRLYKKQYSKMNCNKLLLLSITNSIFLQIRQLSFEYHI